MPRRVTQGQGRNPGRQSFRHRTPEDGPEVASLPTTRYLAGAGSENRLTRYSAWLAMLRLFLGAASKEDVEAAGAQLSEGVIADLHRIRERNRTEAAPLRDVSRWANDQYLKANRVARGVGDDGRAVRLVVGADPAVLPMP